MTISAKAWELLSFFEIEPEFRDPEDSWPYTDALYRVQQGSLSLSVSIAPAERDVRVILSSDGNRIYELNATDIKDVRYFKREDGVEMLEIIITERDSIFLKTKPRIEIKHSVPMLG